MTLPVLQVEVLAGIESNPEDLQFTWNITVQEKDEILVQLYFSNPLLVSSHNRHPDNIPVAFNDPNLFIGMNGLTMNEED